MAKYDRRDLGLAGEEYGGGSPEIQVWKDKKA